MGLFSFRKKKRCVILGLDGVPYEMILSLVHKGVMPRLKEILSTGKLSKMSVSVPEISSVSWSGFMTGTDSGNHGVFGFVDLEENSYEYRFPNFRDLKAPTFFDQLGEYKKRSVIINLPATYPARPLPGVLISGFVALDLKKGLYPAYYYPQLQKAGYKVDVDSRRAKEDKEAFFQELHSTLLARQQVAQYLWKKEKWDLFMFTVTGTDRLHHFLFDAYLDETHGYHEKFIAYYRAVDRVIGDFYDTIAGKEEYELILLSDHGFGSIDKEIYLNPILEKKGFLDLGSKETGTLEDITSKARAFALDPSRIYIHRQGKYPRGGVLESDYAGVREELKQLFSSYSVAGEKVFKKVYFKEELYGNRFLEKAPDIVLLSNHGFDLKGGLKKKEEYGNSHFTGMHLQDNAFFFASQAGLVPNNMTIFQAKDIIFKSLNL